MNMEEYKNIEDLLERFFEGKTSNTEEQQLYAFFGQPDVPSTFLPYKEMFGYFETGIIEECEESPELVLPVKTKRRTRVMWLMAVSVAVSLLFLLFNTVGVKQSVPFNPYEGSYIVRNGVSITDMNEVGPVLETTLQRIEQQQKRVEQLLENANNRDENICLVELNMQQKYRALLNRLPNKYARDEVEKILDIR